MAVRASDPSDSHGPAPTSRLRRLQCGSRHPSLALAVALSKQNDCEPPSRGQLRQLAAPLRHTTDTVTKNGSHFLDQLSSAPLPTAFLSCAA